jgi:hypothetical protein
MQTGFLYISLNSLIFCGVLLLPPVLSVVLGSLVTILSAYYSIRVIFKLISLEELPRSMQRVLARFRFST